MKSLKNILLGGFLIASTLLPGKLNGQEDTTKYNSIPITQNINVSYQAPKNWEEGKPYWDMLINQDQIQSLSKTQQTSDYQINPFSTPNIVYTEYTGHGGGNVNKDDKDIIDWNDYDAMDSMPSHISDIDGDGFPSTDNDKKILAEYLNRNKSYLPGHWNRLQTRQEREDWAKKILEIYKVNHMVWDNNVDLLLKYISGNFKTDICTGTVGHILEGLDYFGDPKIPIFDKYTNKENNGKGNIPVFGVQRVREYVGHGMNAILVGDNPLEFNDWLFYEPQTNKFVDIRKDEASGEFIKNRINIEFFHNFYDIGELQGNANETQMKAFPRPIVFDTEQGTGNVTVGWQDQNFLLNRPTVAIEDNKNTNISDKYLLKQNFPNPFNSNTTISYYLPQEGNIELNIFNLKGQKLETLVSGKQMQGDHKVTWDAEKYPAGIYLYQLQTPNSTQTRKMTSVK